MTAAKRQTFKGKPCPKQGHGTLRLRHQNRCVECTRLQNLAARQRRNAMKAEKRKKPTGEDTCRIIGRVGLTVREAAAEKRLSVAQCGESDEAYTRRLRRTTPVYLKLLITEKLAAIRDGVVSHAQE